MNKIATAAAESAGLTLDNKGKGLCVKCSQPFKFGLKGEPGVNVYSQAGARETQITGYCETCFDNLFEGED